MLKIKTFTDTRLYFTPNFVEIMKECYTHFPNYSYWVFKATATGFYNLF